jgi:hypothetical protein
MDDFKKLYDVLVREGKFTKSYDDFQSKWLEDEEYKNKVYDVVVRDGLFTKEKDSFLEKYSLTPQKKNPIEEEEPLGSPLEEVSMDTTEEIGVGDSSIKEDVVNERTIKYPSGILGKEDSVPEPSNTEIYNNRIQEANMKFANTPNKEDQGYVSNVVSSLDRGFGKNLVGNPVKGLGTLIQGTTGAIMGNDGKGVVSDALIKFGTYINNTVDELAPQDEEFKNSLSDQVGQALGQVASLAVTGLATGAAKASNILTNGLSKGGLWESGKIAVKELGKDMVSPVAISGGLSMGQSEFERAIQGGATDNEAFEVFLKNAAVGSVLERVPMMQFFKRLNKASGGGIIDVLRTRGKAGFSGGAEEFTTEVLQGLYANQTAKDIYNINQKLYEGVAEQGGIGFGVGFLLNAIGVRARLSRDNGDTELAETLEAQLDEFKERAESGAAVYNTDYKVSAHKSTLSSDEIEAMISQGDIAGIQKATEEGKINWKSIPQKTKDKLNIDEQTIGETTYSYPTGIYDSYNPSSQQTTNEQTTTDPTGVPSMDEGAEPNVDQVDAEAGLTAEESTDPQQDLIAELNAKRDIELESAKTKKAQKEINKKYDAELEALPTGDLVSGLKGSTYLDEQSDEDFESLLGNPKFKIESKETEEVNTLETNPESIQEEMSKMPESEINFTEPDVSQDGLKVSPVEESNSTTKISKEESDKLSKPIQYFNGIPMIHGMSDMMAAGVITDSEGNPMSVEGGLLYNVLGKNKENAWAGVNYKGAKTQLDNAEKLYKNNKDLFDKLWAEGKLPDGHVPVAIMRMGNTAVNSNEAVFRWISPAVKKLPKKNRTEAVNVLKGIIDNRLTALGGIESLNTGQKAEVKTLSQLQQFIKKNKIKTLDQLIDAIPVDAKRRAKGNEDETLSLDTRGKLYTLLFSPEGTSKASKKPIAALYDGVKNADQSVFTSDVVYKAIGEPSVLRSKKGEVIGVVGIDVKNGEVTEVEHGNYGFGPKGKPIALISNPKHGIDVFPEWRAKASRVFKPTKPKDKTKEPSLPKEQAVADQVGGAFFTDKAFAGSRPAVGEMTDQDVLVGKLRYAFPNVTVAKTQLEFDNIIKSPNVRTKTSEGEVVLGLTLDGKIYLNPSSKSLNTPIHEFGHIWFDFLRSKESGRKGKQLLAKGLELVTGTTEHNKAMEMYGDTELAKEEALVELMASKGETLIGKAKKEFKSWMNGLFKYIKEKFVGTEDLRMVDIKDMSLDDFVNTGLSDLFKGKSVDKKNRDPEPDPEVSFKKVAKPKESYKDNSATTQITGTTGSYRKAAKTVSENNKGGSVLDYGAGKGKGTDEMSKELGVKVDSYEPNAENWQGSKPVDYEKAEDIDKKYDSVVSLNVVNVVPKEQRDFIVKDIFDKLNEGGVALISSRPWSGDIANTKNYKEGPEEKSVLVKKVRDGEVVDVYQKGFDNNELVDYAKELLGPNAEVTKDTSFGKMAIKIRKVSSTDTNTSEQPQVRFKKQAESTDLDDATQLRNLLVDNQDLIMNEVVFKKLQENGVSIARVNKFRALARNLVKTTLKLNEKFESEGLNAEQQAKAITEDIKKYSKEVAPLRQFVLTMVKDDKIRQIFQDRDTIKQFYKKGKLGEKWQSVMFMMDPTKINPMTMPKALFDEYVEVINNIAKKLKRGQLYGTDIKMIHDFHENLFKNNEDAEIDYIAESIAPYMDQYEAALADESSDGVDNVFFRNLDKAMLEKGEEVLGEDHKKSFKKNKKQILAIVKNKSVEEGVDELDYDIPAKDQQPMWNVAADAINEYNQKSDEDKLVISAKEFVKDKLNNSKLDNDLIDMLNEKDNLEYIFRKGKYHARRDKNIETLLSTIKDIKGLKGDITENIISEREREYVRSLLSIEGKNDLLNFEAYEINQITKTLQGVETGLWLPPIALRLRRKLFANNLSNDLKTTFDNSGILPILDSFGESIPTFEREVREEIQKVLDKGKSKASLKEFIQKKLADSYGIAQLGKMKTDGLEKLMNRVYSAFETTNFLIKKPRTERANLFLKIKKKTEFNGKQYDREEINILVYMKQLQLQFDSNPNSEYVPNLYYLVKDLKINEGVKYDVNSDNAVYEESTAASLWKDFSKKTEGGGDPTLDYKKVNELLSQSNASSYFDFLNKLSTEARSMVQHTVKYSQGKAAEIFTDHVTVRVKEDTNKASDIDPFAKAQPVAKAKTSISRQAWKKAKGGYVVKKISWDAYSISSQSFEDQVRDYHLREEYLNVYSALTVLKNNLDGNGQALVGALQLDLEAKMTVASSKVMSMNSAWGSALRLNKKAILSSLSKIPSETLSNLGFAMTNPKTFSDAFFGGTKLSPEATAILIKEYGSAQINRLIDTKFYSEEVADIREDVVVRPRNAVEALDQKLPGLSNASSSIIGLSDKLVANKMWQAHVARRFKELSGIDWDNNIALEPNLRKKYEAEIRDAMAQADLFVTKRWQGNGLYATSVDFTSGGNYDTAQKSAAVVALMNWFKPFRTGMSSLINESLSQVIPEIPIGKKTYFRTQGYVSRKEAIGNLLGAVGSIMSYGFISKLFSNYLFDAILDTLMGEDDDEPLSVDMKRARNQGLIETALLSTRVGRMNSMAYGMASLTARAVTYGFESDGVEGVSKEIARNFTSGRLSETMLGGHGSLISLASKAFDGKDRSAANHMINASFVAARLSGIPFTKEYLEVIKRMYPDKKKSKGSNNFEGKNYID